MMDRAPLNSLYREHRQGLFSLALSVTRERASAEDAVHDAFARLLREEGRPPDDPVAYVFRAVRNAAIDKGRRSAAFDRAVARIPQTGLFAQPQDNPLDAVIDAEISQRVQLAIDQLTDVQRQTLVMKMYGQLTFDQIARALDEPLGTVTTRYRRTLEKLREQLQTHVEPTP